MKKIKQTEEEETSIRVAVFFDGTGNNRTNSLNNPVKYGSLTNITHLFEACAIADKIYIEGVGTYDNEDDSDWAKATGSNAPGDTGYSYNDKLEKGIAFLEAFIQLHPTAELNLLVYGFSRGATLARDFAKRALANSNVHIRFLGLYDTVKSLIFVKPVIHFTAYEMERVDQILHLVAIHETRKFFPLSSIQLKQGQSELVTIENSYTPKEKEIFVPGAHADVGGGYTAGAEYVFLNEVKKEVNDLKDDLWKIRTNVQDHFSGNQPEAIWMSLLGYNVSFQPSLVRFDMVSKRDNVQIEMARVYFEVMASYSNTFLNEAIFAYNPSVSANSLVELRDDLLQYIISNIPEKGPNYVYEKMADYTHISSNYGKFDVTTAASTLLNTFNPAKLVHEIQRIKQEYPTENFTSFNESIVYQSFELSLININEPNNTNWHREVIYG